MVLYTIILGGGNYGVALAGIAVIAVCINKKHPYIAGVLLAVSMMKPQIAALLILIALIKKQYKLIITGGIVGAIALGVTSIITKTAPWELSTAEATRCDTQFRSSYLGFFDAVKTYDIPATKVILMAAVLGIVYTLIYNHMLGKHEDNEFVKYAGAAIASLFWFYRRPYDYMIVAIASVAIIIYIMQKKRVDFISFFSILFLVGYADITESILKRISDLIFAKSLPNSEIMYGTIAGSFVVLFIGIYILFLYKYDKIEMKNAVKSALNSKCIRVFFLSLTIINIIIFGALIIKYISEKRITQPIEIIEPDSWNVISDNVYYDSENRVLAIRDNGESDWDIVAYNGPYEDCHNWSEWVAIRLEGTATNSEGAFGNLFYMSLDEEKEYFRVPIQLNRTQYINIKETTEPSDAKIYALEFHEKNDVNLSKLMICNSSIRYVLLLVSCFIYLGVLEVAAFFICLDRVLYKNMRTV